MATFNTNSARTCHPLVLYSDPMSRNLSQERLVQTDNEVANAILQDAATFAVVAGGIEYFGPSQDIPGVEQQTSELGYSLILDLFVPVQNNLKFSVRYFFRKFGRRSAVNLVMKEVL